MKHASDIFLFDKNIFFHNFTFIMKEEIKLNKIEINKIEFSQKIIDVFNKYKEIANMFFNVDDYIFSLSLSHKKSCSYIKEKTSLNKIGFLPLNNVKNLNDYQINNIISSNYSKSNISSPLNRKVLKRSANRSLFFQKFFNIVSGLILFNLAIAAAHFIECTFVMRGKYNINKEKIKYIDKKI